jgi:TolB protein
VILRKKTFLYPLCNVERIVRDYHGGFTVKARFVIPALTVVVTAALTVPGPALAAAVQRTERVSVSSSGVAGDDWTIVGDLSANGRYVVFGTRAANLVAGDTNNADDVFLRDRRTGTTTRISLAADGGEADGDSSEPAISDDGRFVAFRSAATDLVPGDTNGVADIFLLDRRSGATTRISVTADGTQADGDSGGVSISSDGRSVAFETVASNLAPGAGTGNVLLHDRTTGGLSLVSVEDGGDGWASAGGSYWASISGNGRYVAFVSYEADMVPGDTNDSRDVFVRDLVAGTTTRASLTHDNQQAADFVGGPDVSDDGRYVTFWSEDPTLVEGDTNGSADVYLRDMQARTTRAISSSPQGVIGDQPSADPRITPDGRYVTFSGGATNLVAGDTNNADDVFVTDLRAGSTRIASRASNGRQGNDHSFNGRSTPDGRTVVYGSFATNLVRGGNDQTHLYLTR